MSQTAIDTLQRSVERRQQELRGLEKALADRAFQLGRRSLVGRVVVIMAGAVIAARAVADQVTGGDNALVAVVFALIGITVAAIVGLESAFGWERHSVEMKQLAATARATSREADTVWHREVATCEGEDRVEALKRVIEVQDRGLTGLQAEAATLGINVSRELDGEDTADNEGPYPA